MPERAPTDDTAGGGEAQPGPKEQREDPQKHGTPGLRQRPSRRPEHPDSTSAADQAARPGPGSFELKGNLVGSVCRWACGERDDGDERAPLHASRLEVLSAWAVLVVSAECFFHRRNIVGSVFAVLC